MLLGASFLPRRFRTRKWRTKQFRKLPKSNWWQSKMLRPILQIRPIDNGEQKRRSTAVKWRSTAECCRHWRWPDSSCYAFVEWSQWESRPGSETDCPCNKVEDELSEGHSIIRIKILTMNIESFFSFLKLYFSKFSNVANLCW